MSHYTLYEHVNEEGDTIMQSKSIFKNVHPHNPIPHNLIPKTNHTSQESQTYQSIPPLPPAVIALAAFTAPAPSLK